ncbi:MAG: hypothetical protein R2867_20065 [Caldilineaceae bacterium]
MVNTTFTLVKNHRALWWAGMLAVILQGGANINVNYSMRQPTPTMRPDGTVDFGQMFAGTIIEDIIANPMPYIVSTRCCSYCLVC